MSYWFVIGGLFVPMWVFLHFGYHIHVEHTCKIETRAGALYERGGIYICTFSFHFGIYELMIMVTQERKNYFGD